MSKEKKVKKGKSISMKIYQKKPLNIEAIQLKKLLDCPWDQQATLPVCIQAEIGNGGIVVEPSLGFVRVDTPEGDMKGGRIDWLIRGIKGEYYICKDDVFKMTYTRVSEQS